MERQVSGGSARSDRTRSSRRQCDETGTTDDPSDLVRELAAQLSAQLNQRIDGVVAQMDNLKASVSEGFGTMLGQYDKKMQRRLDSMDTKIAVASTRLDSHEQSLAEHARRLAEVEKVLATANSVEMPKPAEYDVQWARAPLPYVLRLNSDDMVSRETLEPVVKQWMGDCNLADDMWKLIAPTPAPSRNFTLVLQGAPSIAARRASMAMAALWRPDGTWVELRAKAPSGSESRVYAGPDKSLQQSRIEAVLRRAAREVRRLRPELQTRQLKRDGILSCNWKKLLRIRAPSREETLYEWNESALAELDIPKRTLLEALKAGEDDAAAAAVVWSS